MAWGVVAIVSLGLAVNSAVPLLAAFLRTFALFVVNTLLIDETAHTSAFDQFQAQHGWCSARILGPGRLPADGVHAGWLRGPYLATRTTVAHPRGETNSNWKIYGRRATVNALEALAMGDVRDITVSRVEALRSWSRNTDTTYIPPPVIAYDWQRLAVKRLMDIYRRHGRASILVCGESGVGKSTLPDVLAGAIRTQLHRAARVVKGYDPTVAGLSLTDVGMPTAVAPLIVALDEFDTGCDHAESPPVAASGRGREVSAIADSPTAFTGALDWWAQKRHLIIIATTNRDLTTMTSGKYLRYTRDGRFDLRITATLLNGEYARCRGAVDAAVAPDRVWGSADNV